ncbi:MAG: MFS transporter [Oscillospiraceae bacterium]|nr:MFS transporter [Oscillospiraceae bacterium]
MEKLQRQLNTEYAALQGAYWMAYCMVLSFASVFLLARGYSNSEIGVILAVSNVLALLIQPLAAELADRSVRISILHILWALCVLTAAFLIVASLVTVRSAALSVSYALAFALLIVIQPFMTSLSFHMDVWGVHINFGACRAVGSLAYAVLAAVMGSAVEKLGMDSVPVSGLICTVLFMVFLALISLRGRRRVREEARPAAGAGAAGSGIWQFIRENKRFSLFLLGAALLFATHSLLNNFVIVVVRNVGGDSGDMGRLCGYMAVLEMPAMVLFDRLTRKFRCSALLKFSAVLFTVKAAAIFLAPSVGWMYAAFTLQALSFAVYTPASVKYAMLVVDGKDAVKAQAFLTLTGTLGSIFASLLGGVMFDTIGPSMTLLVGAGFSAVGSVIAVAAIVPTLTAKKG